MMAAPDTEDGEKLDVMVRHIHAYKAECSPLDSPDPVEAIKTQGEA